MMKYLAALAGWIVGILAVWFSAFVVVSLIMSFITWSLWYPSITASGARVLIVMAIMLAVYWTFSKSPHGGWDEWNKK